MPYEKILADLGVKFPDYYSTIVKELSIAEMSAMLNSTNDSGMAAIPRDAYVPTPSMTIPAPELATPTFGVPEDLPDLEIPEVFNPQPVEGAAVPEAPVAETAPAEATPAEPVESGENPDVDNVTF